MALALRSLLYFRPSSLQLPAGKTVRNWQSSTKVRLPATRVWCGGSDGGDHGRSRQQKWLATWTWEESQRKNGVAWRGETALRCLSVSSPTTPPRKEVAVEVAVVVDDEVPLDQPLQALIEQLEVDGPLAVRLAIEDFEDFDQSETVELSVMLCNDACIQELNEQWRQTNTPTDVLSFPQDQPPGESPLLLLGDVVISVETAARQAKERGHTLLDELRVLLVHGLLHVLDYDHELGLEASQEMEKEEGCILSKLGWKGKGLINATAVTVEDGLPDLIPGKADSTGHKPEALFGMVVTLCLCNYAILADEDKSRGDADSVPGSEGSLPPKFKILFCDMDGTLLNSKSMVTHKTANALKEALKRGVQVIIATGKTRPAALTVLDTVGLAGKGGVLSDSTPGVFLQGLQVYGNGGSLIHSERLDPFVVTETFEFSVEHQSPLIGFSGDRCVTLFPHTLVHALHDIYYKPKAEVLECIDQINKVRVQKVLFYDTAERVASFLRPHWTLAVNGRATVVQALPDMMEILPAGASKGIGVQRLLDHLGVPVDQVMAIGDGENDIEMLAMVGWGVAMANGTERTKSVAQAVTSSNDEDGVAKAIEDYIL